MLLNFYTQVKVLLDEFDTNGEAELMFPHFCVKKLRGNFAFTFYDFEGNHG